MIVNRHHNYRLALLGGMLVLVPPSTSTAGSCDWLLCRPESQVTWEPMCDPSESGRSGSPPTYASQWKRVPLTVYRPVATLNPLSGESITTLLPCNTFEWQARRTKKLSVPTRPGCGQSCDSTFQPCPTSYWPEIDAARGAVPQVEAAPSRSPYYERGDTRLVPAPDAAPQATEPADQPPRLGPDGWRSRPPQASANPRGDLYLLDVPRVPPLRGLPVRKPRMSEVPEPPAAGQSVLAAAISSGTQDRWPTAVDADHVPQTLEVWDDSGWKSVRDE